MARIISVVSGKGGVGKTTTVANLSSALATKFNRKVAVVDCNFSTSNLGLSFGIYYSPVTLNHVLRGESYLSEATYIHHSGVRVIPASLNIWDLYNLDTKHMKKVLKDLFKSNDFVFLDSAPGLNDEAIKSFELSDEALIVSTPHIHSLINAAKSHAVAQMYGVSTLGLVLNRVKSRDYEYNEKNIGGILDVPLLQKIPEDERVLSTSNMGVPLVLSEPNSPASVAYYRLAASLINEKYHANVLEKLNDTLRTFMKGSREKELF